MNMKQHKSIACSFLLLIISCHYVTSHGSHGDHSHSHGDHHDHAEHGEFVQRKKNDSAANDIESLDENHPMQLCAAWSGAECAWEPNLKKMNVDFGPDLQETFYAYVTPDVSTFYDEPEGSRTAMKPQTTSMFGKFVNLSPEPLQVFWEPASSKTGDSSKWTFIDECEPFGSAGTATHVGHRFVAVLKSNPTKEVTRWVIAEDNSLYYYDPYGSTAAAMKKLDHTTQLPLYQMQLQNKVFAEQYRKFTGTDWLALYRQKRPPQFHMWRADHFNQTYTVETDQIHFVEMPDDERELTRGMSVYGPRPDEVQRMRRHRDVPPTMNLTLRVLSCAPRVFEIENFLSDVEVDHILSIGSNMQLKRSMTGQGASANANSATRTSRNTWIGRATDFITDAIYQRAADVLQINEALLRYRRKTEIPEFTDHSLIAVSEKLQMVHYEKGQQYTAHHDFSMPNLVHLQPSRFATILFYLNDGMEGGETAFPRWLNAETSEALKVTPKKGKAVLFYSMLPDGNYDERSLHAALPVTKGEKWLTNLWVWDPLLDHTKASHI